MAVSGSSRGPVNELLVCPVCHADLKLEENMAVCSRCSRAYPAAAGIIDFTPRPPPDSDVSLRWPLWEQLESNGRVSYENDPRNNLSVGERTVCDAFARFADLSGRVLDVGCGPQRLPAYAHGYPGAFVGIDPLVGDLPRSFIFVRGIGEYLPFRADSYDRVLFATSLDHTLSPGRALAEARRVVKRSGRIVIWIGEKREAAPARTTRDSHAWYESLNIPDGAEDRFHAVRFDRALARTHVARAGLAVDELVEYGSGSVFVSASPH